MLSNVKVHNHGAQFKLYEMMREWSRINLNVLIEENDLHLFLHVQQTRTLPSHVK